MKDKLIGWFWAAVEKYGWEPFAWAVAFLLVLTISPAVAILLVVLVIAYYTGILQKLYERWKS